MSGDLAEEQDRRERPPVSWPVATWTAPLVPTVVVWGVLLLGVSSGRLGLSGMGTVELELVALVVALLLLGAAALVLRLSLRRRLRGVAAGAAAGSVAVLVVLCMRLASP